ncbi:MAG: hypothetical protein WBD27_10290 [Pyrinomonadaceae bacterium]
MLVTVEIENTANLKRARALLGAGSDSETLEMALEKVIEDYEPVKSMNASGDLPDEYWEELFSQTPILPAGSTSQAVVDERNEDRF